MVRAEITRMLDVEPRLAERKGQQVQRGDRWVTRRSGIWSFALEGAAPDLDEGIAALLERLPADLALWAELRRRFSIDLFCGLFMGSLNEGFELHPSTLRMMGERGLTLGLDIYAPFPTGGEP